MENILRILLTLLTVSVATVLIGCDRSATQSRDGYDENAAAVDASLCDENDGGLELPEGFCAQIVADAPDGLRHIAVRDNGDLYGIHRSATEQGGITAFRDTTGDGKADVVETFGRTAGTGIGIRGEFLYASTDTSIHRYSLPDAGLVPEGDPQTIVRGFPEQSSHAAKSFAFDDEGNIYVNVGAPSNACQQESRTPGSPGMDPCPLLEQHAGIWRFSADTPDQTQMDDGYRFSTGIRNAVAIAWDPASENAYVAQHGRDQLHQLWGDLYTVEESAELPAEELLQLSDGADFGWPYCYYDHVQGRKVLAPEYGGNGEEVGRCSQFEDPVAAFPGHYAPNDLLFYDAEHFPGRYRNGAFVAFHGSWNRAPEPQEGYFVAFVPMEGGEAAGDWETFADGFTGVDVIQSPGDAEYRPMGLALGPDGTLYVSDSQQGRVWRIIYGGEQE